MPSREERREDVGMSVGQSEPSKMLCHTVVLVLSSTVVCMQVHSPLPKAVIVKEVVDATYHNLGTFATVPCIPMHNFTGYTTHYAGLRCMKVDRTRFQCFRWVILLHVARGIVYFDVTELQSRWHTDLVSDHVNWEGNDFLHLSSLRYLVLKQKLHHTKIVEEKCM